MSHYEKPIRGEIARGHCFCSFCFRYKGKKKRKFDSMVKFHQSIKEEVKSRNTKKRLRQVLKKEISDSF